MEDFWNARDLKPPSVFTIKCQKGNIDIRQLKSICLTLSKNLKNNQPIKTEAAVLSRLMYKNKNKFRSDKGFQSLRQIKRCLQRYLQFDSKGTMKYFSSCLPQKDQIHSMVYLPSCQMLQFVLVRLMGLARLLQQTGVYCEAAAHSLGQRIQLGHSWNTASVMLAIVSRIWTLFKNLISSICQSYNELIVFLPILPKSAATWLPPQFTIPPNLTSWLKSQLPSGPKTKKSDEPAFSKIFNLLEDDDDKEEVEVEPMSLEEEIEPVVALEPIFLGKGTKSEVDQASTSLRKRTKTKADQAPTSLGKRTKTKVDHAPVPRVKKTKPMVVKPLRFSFEDEDLGEPLENEATDADHGASFTADLPEEATNPYNTNRPHIVAVPRKTMKKLVKKIRTFEDLMEFMTAHEDILSDPSEICQLKITIRKLKKSVKTGKTKRIEILLKRATDILKNQFVRGRENWSRNTIFLDC